MDRRVVVGLVGLVLAGGAEVCPAQTGPGRDPSAQPSVGLVPIPSIGDSINNTSVVLDTVPVAPSRVPTSPVGLGPDATIPAAPILPTPVSLTPMEPIQQSINRGFGTGSMSSMFRRPNARAAAIPRFRPRTEAAPKLDTAEGPSPRPSGGPTIYGSSPNPGGRPAPYADRSPELPRPQVDPSADPGTGRPAPFAEERPPSARPQAPIGDRAQGPRPRPEPADAPSLPRAESASPAPAEVTPAPSDQAPPATPPDAPSTSPVELPPPPAIGPIAAPPVAATPPPIGSDPLQGMEIVSARPPEAAIIPPAPAPARPAPVDPQVTRTSQDETAVRMKPTRPRSLPYATIRAAAVGDEIITINELATAVNERMRDMLAGQQAQVSESELYQLKNQVAASVLNGLIDQSLILQQANSRMLKNQKAKQMFDDFVDKKWKDEELPPLLRKTASANVYELKIKLTAEGKSYDAMKNSYRKKLLSREYLHNEIRNKVTSDLSELKAYYNAHLDKFEQPARMTWREVEISFARYPNRAAARQKAEEALARLLRDEDFNAVARSTSNGPTASKGGLYVDMQPGSYGIPVVNDELNRLPVGQVSQILEAPGSFHIIRVDSRREKGPLRFDEVQDKIRGQVLEQNFQRAVDDYLARLRAKTLIRTMFDNTASDPDIARRSASK